MGSLFSNNYDKEYIDVFYDKIKKMEHKSIEVYKINGVLNTFNPKSEDILEYCYELLTEVYRVLPEFKLQKRKYRRYKFKKYHKTELSIKDLEDHMISESKEFNFENDLEVNNYNQIIMQNDKISMEEFKDSFKDLIFKKDFMGLNKNFFKSLPTFHMQKLINMFNEILSNRYNVENHAIGLGYLIYKDSKNGPLNDIKSFRNIITIPHIINHFHRILAIRMSKFFIENKFIDTEINKGAIPGIKYPILEQIIKVRQICKDPNHHIMFLDISNAFPSVNILGLISLLKLYNVDQNIISYIKKYYDSLKYKIYIDKNNDTKFIDWKQGLIQGCPMSPILFVLIMNYILTKINDKYKDKYGASIYGEKIMFTAYLDDVCISCNSIEGLYLVYKEIKELFLKFNLVINTDKTKIMSHDKLFLNKIERVSSFKYLGELVENNNNLDTVYKIIFKTLYKRLYRIDKATYNNDVKLYIFKIFVLQWIQKKMLVYYDMDEYLKNNIRKVVVYFLKKWKTVNDLEFRFEKFLFPMLADSKDKYIIKIEKNNYFLHKKSIENANLNFYLIKNRKIEFKY